MPLPPSLRCSLACLALVLGACDLAGSGPTDAGTQPADAARKSVGWEPRLPARGATVTVWGTKPGWLHWGVNGWVAPGQASWPQGTVAVDAKAVETPLSRLDDGRWAVSVGPLPEDVEAIDFVLRHSDGSWDNNHGADYRLAFDVLSAGVDAGVLGRADAAPEGEDAAGAPDAGFEQPDAAAPGPPDAAPVLAGDGSLPANPDTLGFGARKTIVIDGQNTSAEWGDDTLLLRDPAADDARFLGTNWCAHEPPWDYAALHAAWDDTYLYVGIQYVNVTDVLDPANVGGSSASLPAMDLIQFLAFDTVPGQGYSTGGDMWKKGHEFVGANQPDYQLYFHSNFSQEGTYLAKWDGLALTQFTDGLETKDLRGKGGAFYVGGTLPGVDPHADDATPGQYGPASLDYLAGKGHDTARDAFFELQIPLASLGLSAADLDHGRIGLFAGNGDGSGVDSIPNDPATSSTPGVSTSNSPLEWAAASDEDRYTAPFAQVGRR